MKKTLLFLLISLWISFESVGQDRTISGKVTSAEDGSALPGVNVVVKGTTIGTVTDANGAYSLSVPSSGTVLVFTFIGLKSSEVEVGDRSVVDVPMGQDLTQLNEVVVTALGIEKSAKSIGYAVSKVKNEDLTQSKAVNVATALSGKVAGLQINTINNGINPTTRITLRGNRSLTGNNQALVVIDGTQSTSDAINYLNPDDIESVTVLKGANAAALYGADASNGALIITTKKGTNAASTINFSNTTYWESISFMPKFQERFGSGTENYSRVYIPFENQSYGPEFDGSTVDLGRTLEDGTIQKTTYSYKKDAKRKSYDVGHTVQNSLSLTGGDKVSSYFLSLQDVNTTGIVPGDKNRRTSVRFNASRTMFEKLKTSFNVAYALRQTDRTTSDFYFNVLNTPGHIPLNEYRNWRNYKNADGSLNYANPNNYFNDYFYNPFMAKDMNRQKDRYGNLQGNAEVSYQITDWMSALYRAGMTYQSYDYKFTQEKYSYNAYAKSTGKYIAQSDIAGGLTDAVGYTNKIVQDFILTFKKNIGPVTADLIVGSNVREEKAKFVSLSANGLVLPDLYNVSNRVGEASANEFESTTRVVGYYGDLTLGYNEYLYLHASGRRDAYSVLSKDNRNTFYPGVDVSFVASEAISALKNSSILSDAKITASATKVGNVNVGAYALQNVFNAGAGFPYGSLAGYTLGDTYADPNLKPELTTSYEVGGEFGFLDNRVNLELAYYTQKTVDQTVNIDIASSTGYSRATVNAGTLQNSGYEITLKTTPVSTSGGLKWDVNINYADRGTKIKELYQGLSSINLSNYYGQTGDASLGQVFAQVGSQYPIIKAVSYQRDPEGRVVVDPSTGYPLKDPNLKTYGQANPRYFLGIQSSLKFKGFTFNALAEYRGGNVVYHGLASSMWFTGVAEATAAYGRERFIFPNSSYQDADGNYVANTTIATKDGGLGAWDSNLRTVGENFVTSGSFWKLREVSLTYDIPKSILSSAKFIKSASVGLVGRNLLMFLPKENKYTDPEYALDNSNSVGLNSTAQTPPTRTYGFNVSITF
ncbi:SusC/RagA family TonB-linked outer membrane protein [Ohtaekwangia kribbensis]|uniref:SusC/RagA family TonB-linked outer membrane protein n=1 Tax=Ohtaekwangia kribbensis TaxID=688913 RepID=A0ABW3KCH7_9BACT